MRWSRCIKVRCDICCKYIEREKVHVCETLSMLVEMVYLTKVVFFLTALNKLIEKLNKRADKKNTTKRNFKKKERLQKSPSKIPPPSESPAWTVSATFKHTMDATGNADTSPTGTVNSTPTAPVTSASKTARRLLNVELTAFDSSLSDSDSKNYFDSSLSDSDSEN